MNRGLKLAIMCVGILFLTACRQTALQHNLSEEDANEIVVHLYHNGISAEKVSEEKNQETSWNIEVSPADQARARELLVLNHLPRKPSLGLSGVCRDEGLIPTPKREKCRELLAYKGELINSLEKISGIVDADVVLTIPDSESYLEEGKTPPKPTASVVMKGKLDLGGFLPITEEQVQHFVANAVPGMEPGNVTVIITAALLPWQLEAGYARAAQPAVAVRGADEQKPGKTVQGATTQVSTTQVSKTTAVEERYTTVLGVKVHAASAKQFKKVAVVAMTIFLILSALLIFVLYLQIRSKRASIEPSKALMAARPIEAGVDQLLEPTPAEA